MSTDRYCPVHGDPSRPGYEWPCPLAENEGEDFCPHLLEELDRRIEEVEAGNFWQMERDGDVMVFHRYVDHKPTGETKTYDLSRPDSAEA